MIEVWKLFKATELIPESWKYKCIVCWYIAEIDEEALRNKSTFNACPICQAGREEGPKWPHEDVWEYLG